MVSRRAPELACTSCTDFCNEDIVVPRRLTLSLKPPTTVLIAVWSWIICVDMSFCPCKMEVTSRCRSMISLATASTGRGPSRLPQMAPAKTAALKMAMLRIRMTNPPRRAKGSRHKVQNNPKYKNEAGEAASTLIKRAAGGQEFARPCGLISHEAVMATDRSETPQLALTKCPRRFCCQQGSPCSWQKGFSLPKLTVVSCPAETPSETRYCFTAAARRSPRPRLYSVEPRSSQCPSMVAFTDGCALKNSAVEASAWRASARISALSVSKYAS